MFPFDYIFHVFRIFMRLFFKRVDMDKNKQKIYVKWPSSIVPVYLNNDWTVLDLKQSVGEKVNVAPDGVRIIFAGKELDDEIRLQDCDVGEMSIIHAVPSSLQKSVQNSSSRRPSSLTSQLCGEDPNKSSAGIRGDHSKKIHFFVYCSKPCKSMTPGKLRVRCAECKEGTLTLERDPSGWDDVLLPNQIHGTCQSENCDGTISEFYFKCAKHVTSSCDSAVALYLIKNNFKDVPCIACTDVRDLVFVFPCKDAHVICLECFNLYCSSCLSERKFIQDENLGYTLNCPAGCPDSLIKEPHHFKLLGEEQYSRYQTFGAEECLLQAGGVLCPRPGCGAGILPDPECRRIVCTSEGGNGCGFVFCRLCHEGYHIGECDSTQPNMSFDGISCDISDERAGSSRWDKDSKNTIQATTKPCPQCRTPTERDGGCMHMVCIRAQCGFHWCWVCQEEWSRDCMGNHWFG